MTRGSVRAKAPPPPCAWLSMSLSRLFVIKFWHVRNPRPQNIRRLGRVKFVLDVFRWTKRNQRTYHSHTTTGRDSAPLDVLSTAATRGSDEIHSRGWRDWYYSITGRADATHIYTHHYVYMNITYIHVCIHTNMHPPAHRDITTTILGAQTRHI